MTSGPQVIWSPHNEVAGRQPQPCRRPRWSRPSHSGHPTRGCIPRLLPNRGGLDVTSPSMCILRIKVSPLHPYQGVTSPSMKVSLLHLRRHFAIHLYVPSLLQPFGRHCSKPSRVIALTHPPQDTLHPTPYSLHPTPYTPHPTPYTLHPTRKSLGIIATCHRAHTS